MTAPKFVQVPEEEREGEVDFEVFTDLVPLRVKPIGFAVPYQGTVLIEWEWAEPIDGADSHDDWRELNE